MEYLQKHEIRKLSSEKKEYELILYLNDQLTEFADELGNETKVRENMITSARLMVKERYPNIHITVVKVLIGGMVVASIPLTTNTTSAEASGTTSTAQMTQSSSIYYQVQAGDTLWNLAQTFNSSVDHIKRGNLLTSDVLQLNQKLIIPKAFHKVGTGDYLSVLAKKYGTTIEAIKEANQLPNDTTTLGQTLIIPMPIQGNEATTTLPPKTEATSYTVVAGDSLWAIANRFGTTVDKLKSLNHLTSDMLRVGQVLTIPVIEENLLNNKYTVVSGDSLWAIATRFGVTVTDLKSTNNLTSDMLQPGQTLIIPTVGTGTIEAVPKSEPIVEEGKTTFTYTVRSGDSLSIIANQFSVTLEAIRLANNLNSDMILVGQVLTIPNGLNVPEQNDTNSVTYITHTVSSGDNIWDLSIRYGIPQAELLRVNNLTMNSSLTIGQTLTIPVYNIAVKEVVSEKHGEYLDWWTEAQYVFPIGKTAKITDFVTGKSFYIKRTIGANHADSETLTKNDSTIAKSIWGGYSWTPRAVIIEVDGRKLAASMSFMPHDIQYITDNGITGHFDVYFGNSTRHVDGKADPSHQTQIEIAAGLR